MLRRLETLEEQKAAVFSELSAWQSARLRFRPEPASWSALHVVDHLVKVEQALIATVRANLPDGHPVGLKERVQALAVIAVMISPLRVKVPASVQMVLPEDTDGLPAITARWSDVRKEMTTALTALSAKQLGRGLFLHPVSGWMTAPTALAFLSSHLRHHGYQLERLKRFSSGM